MQRNLGEHVKRILGNSSRDGSVSGCVDEVRYDAVSGWILVNVNGLQLGDREIELWADGKRISSTRADLPRPDVAHEKGSTERCGFTFHIPLRSVEGLGSQALTVIDKQSGGKLESDARMTAAQQRVLVDVGDTLIYFTHHASASGIQRVVTEVSRTLFASGADGYHLVAGRTDGLGFGAVEWSDWLRLLDAIDFDSTQVRSIAAETLQRAQSGRRVRGGSGSLLLNIGSPWISNEYIENMLHLRTAGTSVVSLVYDLIPVRQPDAFDVSTRDRFDRVMSAYALASDSVMAISEYSRGDFVAYCRERGLPVPPTSATRLASSLGAGSSGSRAKKSAKRQVLLVSTIEGRKGHQHALRVWQRLLAELPRDEVPELVFVGRPGWKSQPLYEAMSSTGYLGGKLTVLTEVDDQALRELYSESLFTLYPSLFEGWGLPVGESLAVGTPVIASDSTSIPEVGGSHACYVPSGDDQALYERCREWILNRSELEKWRQASDSFVPDTWEQVTERIVAVIDAVGADGSAGSRSTELPVGQEACFTLKQHVQAGDDWLTTSWNRDLLRECPITRMPMLPGSEARASLLVQSPTPVISEEGRAISMGATMRLGFSVPDADEELLFYVSVVARPMSRPILCRISGDAVSGNIWIRGEQLLQLPIPAGPSRPVVVNIEANSLPDGDAEEEPVLVVRSALLQRSGDTEGRMRIAELRAGIARG